MASQPQFCLFDHNLHVFYHNIKVCSAINNHDRNTETHLTQSKQCMIPFYPFPSVQTYNTTLKCTFFYYFLQQVAYKVMLHRHFWLKAFLVSDMCRVRHWHLLLHWIMSFSQNSIVLNVSVLVSYLCCFIKLKTFLFLFNTHAN